MALHSLGPVKCLLMDEVPVDELMDHASARVVASLRACSVKGCGSFQHQLLARTLSPPMRKLQSWASPRH